MSGPLRGHTGKIDALESALRELTEAAEAVVETGFVASPDLWQRLRVAAEAARAVLDPPVCHVFEDDDLRGLER